MHFFIQFSCEDPSNHLGRLDYASLSQQALMEMVVDDITNREKITGSKEDPKEISKWEGVEFDEKGDVISIYWENLGLEGRMSMEWLPLNVQRVVIPKNKLCGTIESKHLPPSLKFFSILQNEFASEVDFSRFPEKLSTLVLSQNNFTGSVNLDRLPTPLYWFAAAENAFTGTVNLTQLPDGLQYFDVSENQLSGSIDPTSLPEDLERLYLSNNAFCGTIDLECLPHAMKRFDIHGVANIEGCIEIDAMDFPDLRYFNVSNTNLHGIIWVGKGASAHFMLENSNVKLIRKS